MAFVPSDLSSIIAHWRSEDIPSGGADPLNWDDVVSAWRLSATGTARPVYAGSAIGGMPGLDFVAASSQCLRTASSKNISTGQTGIAIVCKRDLTAAMGLVHTNLSSGFAFGANTRVAMYTDSGNGYLFVNSSSLFYTGISIPTATDLLVSCEVGDGDIAYKRNGLSRGISSATQLASTTGNVYVELGGIGGAYFWDGLICEVVVWAQSYTQKQDAWVEGYLAHKFGIALPTWHPFYAAAPTSGPTSGSVIVIEDD